MQSLNNNSSKNMSVSVAGLSDCLSSVCNTIAMSFVAAVRFMSYYFFYYYYFFKTELQRTALKASV